MPELLTAGDVMPLAPTDRIMVVRDGQAYMHTIEELAAAFQTAISLAAATLLGRSAGSGAPQQLGVGAGIGIGGGELLATAEDHLGLALLHDIDVNAELIVNSGARPARLPLALLLAALGGPPPVVPFRRLNFSVPRDSGFLALF